jgi:hypothetical protein
VETDNRTALRFLRLLAPNGPWLLTGIDPERKGIETRTFRPGSEADLEGWLTQFNGRRNIYYSVNPPMKDMDKKAERENIKELAWLHVDIDPRAGEDMAEEQARALSKDLAYLLEGAREVDRL